MVGSTLMLIVWLIGLVGTVIALVVLANRSTHLTIPYNPTFLTQVHADNVSSINSQGNSIQGVFKRQGDVQESADSAASRRRSRPSQIRTPSIPTSPRTTWS